MEEGRGRRSERLESWEARKLGSLKAWNRGEGAEKQRSDEKKKSEFLTRFPISLGNSIFNSQ